jgi:Gluconate 2-dehydrogenase subunit 3
MRWMRWPGRTSEMELPVTPVMNRRDAVKTASLLVGGAVAASAGLLGCARGDTTPDATAEKVAINGCCALAGRDSDLLLAFADTLLPDTAASPGAKAAGCGAIMNMLLSECSDPATQKRVIEGIVALRTRSATFDSMPPAERERLLIGIEAEARRDGAAHWYNALRDLSQRAYFSSEVGMTKVLRYVRVPGRWTGCTPLAPGQPAWG